MPAENDPDDVRRKDLLIKLVEKYETSPLRTVWTEKLDRWSLVLLEIFKLMVDARTAGDERATWIARELGDLSDGPLFHEMHEFFNQRSERLKGN